MRRGHGRRTDWLGAARRRGGNRLLLRLLVAAALLALELAEPRGAAADAMAWQAALDLSVGSGEQHDPDLLALTDGSLQAIWVDDLQEPGSSLWAAVRLPGATAWQEPRRVESLVPGDASPPAVLAAPQLAEDPWGRVHAIWIRRAASGASVWHAYRRPGWPSWSLVERIDGGGDIDREDPDLVADTYGSLHAVWTEGRQEVDIAYATKVSDAAWTVPVRLNNPPEGVQRRPVLAAAPDGNLYAAWEDTRDGRSGIAASRLPPGGDVWWPNAMLAADAGSAAQRAPVISIDPAGRPVVAWLDQAGLGRIRVASLDAPEAFWHAEGVWYEARLGPLQAMDLVAGPSGSRALVWTEGRADAGESRLYGAFADRPDGVMASRVDAGRGLGRARDPRAVLDRDGRLNAVWLGKRDGEALGRVRASRSERPLQESLPTTLAGRLLYAGLPVGCPAEAFVLVDCDGQVLSYLRQTGPELAPYLGSWVAVTGGRDQGAACQPLRGDAVHLQTGPCPRAMAIVTGLLRSLDRPVDDGHATIGESRAFTGPGGRYALALGGGGPAELTLGAPCALERRLSGLTLIDGLNRLPDIELLAGDIDGSCRVDLLDVVQVSRQQGLAADLASPRCADLDRDGVVSLLDAARVAAAYGSRCDGALADGRMTIKGAGSPLVPPLWLPMLRGKVPVASP